MSIEIINPKDEAEWLQHRTKDITSTEVSALFGISPYITAFELWHRKKDGVVVKLEENKRMFWGTHLQDAIAAGIAKENGWEIRRKDEYIRNKVLRIGSSFDFEIINTQTPPLHLLEIKNIDGLVFKNEWLWDENGNLFAPLHIEIQVQHQLLVTGAEIAYIGVLVGGNDHKLLKRTPDIKVHDQIKRKVADFWASIEANEPPKPDFEIDAEFISELFAYSEPGKIVDLSENNAVLELAMKYKEFADIEKAAKLDREKIKAQMLSLIGDAEKAIGNGFTISVGTVAPCHMEYDRAGYRNFKINWKKQREDF